MRSKSLYNPGISEESDNNVFTKVYIEKLTILKISDVYKNIACIKISKIYNFFDDII